MNFTRSENQIALHNESGELLAEITFPYIDNDTVDISNLNRQIHATYETVDKVKVDVMKERILSINKDCNVITHRVFVNNDNIEETGYRFYPVFYTD